MLSWVSEFIDSRMTAPRRGRILVFDTSGLNAADLADLHLLRSWRRGPSRRFFFRFAFDLVGAFEGAGGSVGC